MKKLLMVTICLTALSGHCSTQEEEVRYLIRELVERKWDDLKTSKERQERLIQLHADLNALEHDVVFPVYYKMLEEKNDDLKYINFIVGKFLYCDGRNAASYGQQEALDWTRKLLQEQQGQGFYWTDARSYLVAKGDERDIGLVTTLLRRKQLTMRVAGTNLINYWQTPHSDGVHWYGCVPSVTNTGPQGAYVQEILRQAWESIEVEIEGYDEFGQPIKFRDESKMPAELLTIVVWFDEDGNPVCNVDLAKYGLTMPELDIPNRPKGRAKASRLAAEEPAATNVATASLPSVEGEAQLTTNHYPLTTTADTPPNRLWLYALIPLFLCAGAGLWFIRKKR